MVALRDKTEEIWSILDSLPDPEIPVISIVDLGIVRDIREDAGGVTITITPTYSGCPAMKVIALDIETKLARAGHSAKIETQLSPAWTTDWLSEKGRARLEEYGIAPPERAGGPERCPQCKSSSVSKISQFGSTPCKAQWRCDDCLEPFDYFKCI